MWEKRTKTITGLMIKTNMEKVILKNLREKLKGSIDLAYQKRAQTFNRELVKSLGVRTPLVRKIAKYHFRELKHLSKKEVFSLCEKLFSSGYREEITVAIQWATYFKKEFTEQEFTEQDFNIFEKWFSRYVVNWESCDDFCLSLLSYFIVKFPQKKEEIKEWTGSTNRWKRRASAVSFIRGGDVENSSSLLARCIFCRT